MVAHGVSRGLNDGRVAGFSPGRGDTAQVPRLAPWATLRRRYRGCRTHCYLPRPIFSPRRPCIRLRPGDTRIVGCSRPDRRRRGTPSRMRTRRPPRARARPAMEHSPHGNFEVNRIVTRRASHTCAQRVAPLIPIPPPHIPPGAIDFTDPPPTDWAIPTDGTGSFLVPPKPRPSRSARRIGARPCAIVEDEVS
jgi:hypothetical protein